MAKVQRAKLRPSPPPPKQGHAWFIPLAALAFGVRLWHLHQISRAPFSDLLLGDAAAYDEWARAIAAGNWIGDRIFYQAPLYPYLLAGVYAVLGRSAEIVRLLQAVLGVISCLLVADAGRRLFSRRAGMAAGVLLAIYPPSIFLESLIQKSALDECLLCTILWLIARDAPSTRRSTAVFVGLATGALILNRENALALVLPLSVWFATRPQPRRWRQVPAFLGAIALLLTPVAARNRIVGGEWAITTAQFGPNFYIGNNPTADGTYRPLVPWRGNPTFEQRDATALAEHESGRALTPVEVSRFYTKRVLEFVSSDPAGWLRLLGRKIVLTFNAVEIPDTEDQYTFARWSWPLRIAGVWNFATLLALAALGAWCTRATQKEVWVLPAIAVTYAASVVLFYVFARYRFLLVPPLIVLAGAAVAQSPAYLRNRSLTERVACAALFAGILVACGREIVPRNRLEALMRFNTAVGLERSGRIDAAIAEYRDAARLYSALPQVHYNLGLAYQQTRRLEAAISELREAVRWAPRDPRALNNLGVALGQTGDRDGAAHAFKDALLVDPNLAEAHGNLAEWHAAGGDLAAAAADAETAVRLAPTVASAWKTLARVRGAQGRHDEALAAAQAAVGLAPDDSAALNVLGISLAELGRNREARAAFQHALERDPGNSSIRRNLMRLQAFAESGG